MVQIVLILDFVFLINNYLVERDGCKMTLILGSIILFAASFGLSSLAYYYYAMEAHCSRNILFISWTIIIGVIIALLSVSPTLVPFEAKVSSPGFLYMPHWVATIASKDFSLAIIDHTSCILIVQNFCLNVQVVQSFIS